MKFCPSRVLIMVETVSLYKKFLFRTYINNQKILKILKNFIIFLELSDKNEFNSQVK